MTLTKARRARLERLAAYLESLPKSYQHFDMGLYIRGEKGSGLFVHYARHNGGVDACGTVACAVGHGPAAGILVPPRMIVTSPYSGAQPKVDWDTYSELFVGVSMPLFQWCFASAWDEVDNHHWGAAARIRYLLDKGAPPEGFDSSPGREFCKDYAPYRRDSRSKPDRAETRSGSVHESGGSRREIAQ